MNSGRSGPQPDAATDFTRRGEPRFTALRESNSQLVRRKPG